MRALRVLAAVLAELALAMRWPAAIVGGAVLLLLAGWSTARPILEVMLR